MLIYLVFRNNVFNIQKEEVLPYSKTNEKFKNNEKREGEEVGTLYNSLL